MTPQSNTVIEPVDPNAWMQQYGNPAAAPSGDDQKIKVLARRTLYFVEGVGTQGRHTQVISKTTVQDVDAWITKTPTYLAALKDGGIVPFAGQSTLQPQLGPPTVNQVMTARGCSQEEAEKIVALEQIKFDQGEYPYPAKNATPEPAPVVIQRPQPPTLEQVMATGNYKKAAAQKIVDAEQRKFEAGVFPYGATADPKYWSADLDEGDKAPGEDPGTPAADSIDPSQR